MSVGFGAVKIPGWRCAQPQTLDPKPGVPENAMGDQ